MDAPAPSGSPNVVDEFGLPPPAPRKPVEDDPESEVAPTPPAPVTELEHHPDAAPTLVMKEGDTLKIVPAAESPKPAEAEAEIEAPKPAEPEPKVDTPIPAEPVAKAEPLKPAASEPKVALPNPTEPEAKAESPKPAEAEPKAPAAIEPPAPTPPEAIVEPPNPVVPVPEAKAPAAVDPPAVSPSELTVEPPVPAKIDPPAVSPLVPTPPIVVPPAALPPVTKIEALASAVPEAKPTAAVEHLPVPPPISTALAAAPPIMSATSPKVPEAPTAPVPVPVDHAAVKDASKTASVEPLPPPASKPEAPVAGDHVAGHEVTVSKAVPVDDEPPAPAAAPELAHHDTATTATTASTAHLDTASKTATLAPSTRTDVTRTDMSSRGRTAASLADLPTPTEIFAGHVAEHPTTLVMRDGQILDDSGEALYRINGKALTDRQHAPVFDLRRGYFRRRTWTVKPNGGRKQLRIRSRQHYGLFYVPMPPESTGGAKNREAVLHANQLRLGASKSLFENKAIVAMVEGDRMQVAKGFDLALAGAMWKAQADTYPKHERRIWAIDLQKTKSTGRLRTKLSNISAHTA